MQVISLNDYRKEGAAAVRPSPSVAPVKDKSERHKMHRIWREAESIADYYSTLNHFTFAAHRAARAGLVAAAQDLTNLGRNDLLKVAAVTDLYRAAIADMIRTPAPTQQQIWWKKRQLKDGFLFDHISPEEARAAIAADEAFHRDNPARKPRAPRPA